MPHLRMIWFKRPWNKVSAIFSTIMKEHAKIDLVVFAVRWVTLGLRVDVNCAPKGFVVSMVPFVFLWLLKQD